MAESDLIITISAKADKAKEVISELLGESEHMNESLKVIAIAGAAAFGTMVAAIGESVKAYAEQERATRGLTLALQNQGMYSEELKKEYIETAEAIERKTGADADAIVSGQGLLQSFIGQHKITEELTKAVVDASTVTGKDLNGSFMAVARAVETGTLSIGRFRIQLDPTLTDSERLAKVQEILGQKFGGAAEEAVQGINSWATVQASFRSLERYVGEQFAPAFESAINLIRNDLEAIKPVVKSIADFWSQNWHQISAVFNAIVYSIIVKADGLAKVLTGVLHLNVAEIKEGFLQAVNAAQAGVDDYNQAMQEGYVIEEMDLRGQNKKKAALARADSAERAAIRDAERQAKILEGQVAYLEITAQGSKELELKKRQLADLEKASKTHNKALQAAFKADAADQVAQQNALGSSLLAIDTAFHSQKVKAAAEANSELTGMQQSHNDVLKGIGKAAAIADIIMNTETAVMRVIAGFSSIPFIGTALGIAAAGAVVAYSGERIAQVVAAADGGLIAGGIPGKDSVHMLGMPGELVVPAQNFDQVVSAYAASQGMAGGDHGGGGTARIEITLKADAAKVFEAQIVERQRLNISLLKRIT